MATDRATLWARVNSLCVGDPFRLVQGLTPFDFDHQPSGRIDQVFRIEVQEQGVTGGLNFSEDRTDLFTIWLARKQNADSNEMYRLLLTDVTSLTAAIARDGATGGGDYAVLDGGGVSFQHESGKEYAVARLALPINYESQL
jgi:hypothetical protein